MAPAESVVLCAQLEAELADLDAADAAELLAEYGQQQSGLEQLVPGRFPTRSACRPSSRPGPKEARAWTIHVGDTAPEAAGVIHTDFQKGFIKAEVVGYEDLVAAGSVAGRPGRRARPASKGRTT